MSGQMDRRKFVKVGVCAGAGLAVAGTAWRALVTDEDPSVETPSSSYGEERGMGKRVLVGYATKNGSTVGVAEAIGRALGARGFAVDVKPLSGSPSVSGYDAVVLGSAVNGGQWLPEAVSYVERNAGALGKVPVAAFCVHMMNAGDDAGQTAKRRAYLDKVRSKVKLADEGYFLGRIDEMGVVARWAFMAFGGAGQGDCRDWHAIASWAERARIEA